MVSVFIKPVSALVHVAPLELPNQSAPGPLKSHPTANAWTRPGWNGPLARPAGLPARLSGEGRTGGTGLRWQKERLTRTVRRVAGRYGPVPRATFYFAVIPKSVSRQNRLQGTIHRLSPQ